jgi:mRNA interferase MazF
MVKYIPNRGDIVRLNFTPQSGKEQAGKRPAIVLSPKKYNEKVGLALCCPITSQKKGYPFEIELQKTKTTGVILSDHIKSLDWAARNVEFTEKAPTKILTHTLEKIEILLF